MPSIDDDNVAKSEAYNDLAGCILIYRLNLSLLDDHWILSHLLLSPAANFAFNSRSHQPEDQVTALDIVIRWIEFIDVVLSANRYLIVHRHGKDEALIFEACIDRYKLTDGLLILLIVKLVVHAHMLASQIGVEEDVVLICHNHDLLRLLACYEGIQEQGISKPRIFVDFFHHRSFLWDSKLFEARVLSFKKEFVSPLTSLGELDEPEGLLLFVFAEEHDEEEVHVELPWHFLKLFLVVLLELSLA